MTTFSNELLGIHLLDHGTQAMLVRAWMSVFEDDKACRHELKHGSSVLSYDQEQSM